jgi:4-hydroxy-tetrahydrodipicolinate synthase
MIKLKGTGVALVTPMHANGEPDYLALEKLVRHVAGEVDYLVALGTTGESATLSAAEKKEVFNTIKSVSAGKLPLVLGLGGNDTHSLIRQMDTWDWAGIDAVLSVSPYYNKPGQAGLAAHYTLLADACPRPLVLYNVPGRTGSNISAKTTLQLAQHPNICGIKEASGNVEQCMAIAAGKPEEFVLISGDDMLTPALIAIGAEGVISVLANALPAEFSAMVGYCLAFDFSAAKNLWKNWIELNPLLYEEGNPVGIKALMAALGICQPGVRMPLAEASPELKSKLNACLRQMAGQEK